MPVFVYTPAPSALTLMSDRHVTRTRAGNSNPPKQTKDMIVYLCELRSYSSPLSLFLSLFSRSLIYFLYVSNNFYTNLDTSLDIFDKERGRKKHGDAIEQLHSADN